MSHLKIAFKNTSKIKAAQNESVNTLAKIFQANHEKRELKKLLKKQKCAN